MKNDTYERVNITLPSRTLRHLDRVAKPGERSGFINDAVTARLYRRSRKELVEGYKRAAKDPEMLELAEMGIEDFFNHLPPE